MRKVADHRLIALASALCVAALTCVVCHDAPPASAKNEPSPSSAAAPKFESMSKAIAQKWLQKPIASAKTRAVISFKVNSKDPKTVTVYNSSHDDKFDASAKAAVIALLPIQAGVQKDGTELRARFDPFVHSVDVYRGQDPDFGPYMALVQRTVKQNWFPPKRNESKHSTVFWKVWSDGTVSNVRLDKSCGDTETDEAGLKAVRTVGKLRPLPSGSPDNVDIQFTFDYNVKGKPDDQAGKQQSEPAKSTSEAFGKAVDKLLRP